MGILVKLLIFFMISGIIFYLALSKNRFIPKSIKTFSQFLLLPLHPYLKYGNSIKGMGGPIAIFIGIALMIFFISFVFEVTRNIIK